MRAGYGEKLRAFLATKAQPKILIDFAGQKIFESATVDTNILLFERRANTPASPTLACIATEKCRENMSVFVKQHATAQSFKGSDSWVILSPIEKNIKEKIERIGVPLKNWDISINYGIKTGFNDAFIIDEAKRAEILANCKDTAERKRTDEIIRPFFFNIPIGPDYFDSIALTNPSMVCSFASTSGLRPRATIALLVSGPMDASLSCG
jgi:type II restriction/modification system DNA methylase subunit YeeA